jgi:hypothetical protein
MVYPRRSCSRTDSRSSYLSSWFMPGSPRQALNARSAADTRPSLPGPKQGRMGDFPADPGRYCSLGFPIEDVRFLGGRPPEAAYSVLSSLG